jgi:hypothetical protein
MAELVDWSDTMCYNLIGEPNINEFDGRRIVQIIISAIERVKLESDEERAKMIGIIVTMTGILHNKKLMK